MYLLVSEWVLAKSLIIAHAVCELLCLNFSAKELNLLHLEYAMNSWKEFLWNNCERLIFFTIFLLAVSILILIISFLSKGVILKLGIDFKGGTEVSIETQESLNNVENALGKNFENVRFREIFGEKRFVVMQSTEEISERDVENSLKSNDIEFAGISVRSLDPSVSKVFFREGMIALIFAFVLMGTIIFFVFKNPVPSIAAILSVIFDIVITVAVMNLLGIELTLGSLAALLMLVGYSVDTDILLSTKVIKQDFRKENFFEAMSTGLMFSATAIAAFLVLLLISNSPALDSIASVVLIGLIVDLPSTWIQNAALLKIFLKGGG